jgi:NTP pyrophosphatase (non-canonical NTP hydrolase)
MDALNATYAKLMALYEDHVKQAMETGDIQPHVETLKSLNQQIADVLDQMIAITAKAKESHATLARDDLMRKLDRIQKDYNGLAQSSDQLETLKRIRRDQTGTMNQFFWTYFWLFIVLCLFVLVMLFFKKSVPVEPQSSVSVMSTPRIAAPTPAFT